MDDLRQLAGPELLKGFGNWIGSGGVRVRLALTDLERPRGLAWRILVDAPPDRRGLRSVLARRTRRLRVRHLSNERRSTEPVSDHYGAATELANSQYLRAFSGMGTNSTDMRNPAHNRSRGFESRPCD